MASWSWDLKHELGEEKGSEWGNGFRKEGILAKGAIICKRSGDPEGERIDLFEDLKNFTRAGAWPH